MADGGHVRIVDIPATGVELGDDELTGIVGGMRNQYSSTIGGLDTGGLYCDCDAGF